MARTWILTGSPEHHAATRSHDFTVIGPNERNRERALGDEHARVLLERIGANASGRVIPHAAGRRA